jgi:Protein of unknown function (DUF4238)
VGAPWARNRGPPKTGAVTGDVLQLPHEKNSHIARASQLSRPIDHHHLPIFYLTGWGGPDGRIVRYWRPNDREVKASPIAPKNTGFEPHLYSLSGYPEDQREVIEERFFGPVVDDPASRALKVLIERDQAKLTEELRVAWTRFMMASRVRSPDMVDEIQRVARKHLEDNLLRDPHEYDALRRDGDPPTLLEWAELRIKPRPDNSGKFVLPDLAQNSKIGEALIHMKWATLDLSAARHELLTSDQPFVVTRGLTDRRCVVGFPLNPRFAFVATHDRVMERRLLSMIGWERCSGLWLSCRAYAPSVPELVSSSWQVSGG